MDVDSKKTVKLVFKRPVASSQDPIPFESHLHKFWLSREVTMLVEFLLWSHLNRKKFPSGDDFSICVLALRKFYRNQKAEIWRQFIFKCDVIFIFLWRSLKHFVSAGKKQLVIIVKKLRLWWVTM